MNQQLSKHRRTGGPGPEILDRIRRIHPTWADAFIECGVDDASVRTFYYLLEVPGKESMDAATRVLPDP